MPFEQLPLAPRHIAVVGGGISGMGAAWLLSGGNRVTLFEAEPRLGGHARTVLAGRRGEQPVDTGFIVFNYQNYPNLARLFAALDVPVTKSNMSFAASVGDGWLEYSMRSFHSVLCQPRNALRPGFWAMIADILRFNARALAAVEADPDLTLGGLFDRLGVGPWFRQHYFLPISGAIWSTPVERMTEFPARTLIDFFRNHALLQARGQHQWFTVNGGSVEYVRRLEASLRARGIEIRTGAPVASVRRAPEGVWLRAAGGVEERFDEVVLATHTDVSLAMLADAEPEERAALAAIRYQPNEAVLHADPHMMPRRRACWASWNYVSHSRTPGASIPLTYWMNSLQPIPADDPLFVTLNPERSPREELVHDVTTFHHPVYDRAALDARAVLRARQGQRGTWFCGAWMKNGFHEDGLASAVDVAEALGAVPAWA
ncbi:MAG: cyclopropane-fatty-acyl-phospholipid synthase [Alphaproteobacteria bacterium HGW-Alphaproteobacteria-2]|nr:MAG: cyclopropane-fatty-acyl-phospholipid synthase [Alphaproteobacteria bacterium HGW-Alphaproteobacteria-2]